VRCEAEWISKVIFVTSANAIEHAFANSQRANRTRVNVLCSDRNRARARRWLACHACELV